MEIKNKDLYKKSLLLSIFILITSLLITSIGYKEGLFLSYFKDIRVLIYNFIPIFLIIIAKTGYWSLSPGFLNTYAFSYIITSLITSTDLNAVHGVRPVISLTPEYVSTMTGTGTMTDPYRAAS